MQLSQGMTNKIIPFVLLLGLSGCTSMITERFANNLGNAILSQTDPEVAAASIPTFMVMMDSLVLDAPKNPTILSASANLNGAYASLFASSDAQAKQLTEKALQQARTAICTKVVAICSQNNLDLDQFKQILASVDKPNIDLLYSLGTAWAGWIQIHRDDWNGLAQVPKVEAVMNRVIELDENFEWGRGHLYLAVINSQLPPALGGKPEIGRMHFEKAIDISEGQDLIAKVEFARHYARLMFDQELHDELLNDVMNAETSVVKLNLSNAVAKQQAKQLLSTSVEYFEE